MAVVVASAVSLLAATILVRNARSVVPDLRELAVALCLLSVALAWAMTHTAFAFRYAHLYYRDDVEGVGGIMEEECATILRDFFKRKRGQVEE